jgi:F-type H+-transporting ATPase subunit gamma
MAGGKSRGIKRRIKSVKSTKQITKAMEMVSSAKFKRYNSLVLNSRPYSESISKILQNIAVAIKNEHHPLFEPKKEVKKVGLIVVTSDRGLCGSYNNYIIKDMMKFIRENKDKDVSVIAIGRKVRDYCRKHDINMKAEYTQLVPEEMFDKSRQVSENIVEFFDSDIFDEVYILYSKFISAVNSQITLTKLLPVQRMESEENVSYIFEPNEEEILSSLLPKYLNIAIYQNLLEATASEHSARMKAMKSATDNASDMIDKLTLSFNRARQSAITQEISEIVSGADALK